MNAVTLSLSLLVAGEYLNIFRSLSPSSLSLSPFLVHRSVNRKMTHCRLVCVLRKSLPARTRRPFVIILRFVFILHIYPEENEFCCTETVRCDSRLDPAVHTAHPSPFFVVIYVNCSIVCIASCTTFWSCDFVLVMCSLFRSIGSRIASFAPIIAHRRHSHSQHTILARRKLIVLPTKQTHTNVPRDRFTCVFTTLFAIHVHVCRENNKQHSLNRDGSLSEQVSSHGATSTRVQNSSQLNEDEKERICVLR